LEDDLKFILDDTNDAQSFKKMPVKMDGQVGAVQHNSVRYATTLTQL